MKKLIRPPYLQQQDQIIIVSPSGNTNREHIDDAKKVLESWDLNVKTSTYAYQKYGRFGGTVEQRVSDLQSSMDDKNIKLIFCSRGGYGIVHLLDKLDFTGIKKYPKWLVGFSDVTALHLAFAENGLQSLHAPMARHLAENGMDASSNYIKQALFLGMQSYNIAAHELNISGNTEGILFGGNLAVLCGLIGTSYMRTFHNRILFIEDTGERPYKIDRMMWQLKLSGILANLSGLIVGKFTSYQEDPLMNNTVYESIHSMTKDYGYPVIFNFHVGHVTDNYTLVHGGVISINCENNIVTIENKN